MGYVAVKGGEAAIEASIERLKYERLKTGSFLSVEAVSGGMKALIDQVMSEGSLYDEGIAAIAIKQAAGSPEEAVFLVRAYRSTLPRKHYSIAAEPSSMRVERRVSACFKDIPGGQILGTSADYTHRLIDRGLCSETPEENESWLRDWNGREPEADPPEGSPSLDALPNVIGFLREEGLLPRLPIDDAEPHDVTKKALEFPTVRSERLQILTRGQTGAVTALGYAALRSYGALHPTVGELRVGMVAVYVANPSGDEDSTDDAYYVGEVRITEVESLVPVPVERGQGRTEIEFDIGYGACFGQNETKAIAMSILDQCLESGDKRYPTQDEEFVLMHVDSVEATGFISHLKLPHYVTFQSKLDAARRTRAREAGK
jgi:alpha-D-ribose 1-methylphosphonate 5-triphosphate synthase subunit PhnI